MTHVKRALALAISAWTIATASTHAAVTRWTLSNVAFADGGTATGFFSLNGAGDFVKSNVSVSGGDQTTFAPFTYNKPTTGPGRFSTVVDFVGPFYPAPFYGFRQLIFLFASPLNPSLGSEAIDTSTSFSHECYGGGSTFGCSPSRTIVSGEVVTNINEPATVFLLGALLAATALGTRRVHLAERRF